MMKRALVTGATGFIGAHLVKELTQNGIEVIAVVRPQSAGRARIEGLQGIRIVECPLCGMKDLPQKIGTACDVFYHLAWEGASGPLRPHAQTQAQNALYALEAAQAAQALQCKRFVAAGTIYEKLCGCILDAAGFRTPAYYVLSKCYTRQMLSLFAKKTPLTVVWCTFFHPTGRYIKREQMMAYTVSSLYRGEPPRFGPALEPYDIIAVDDVAYGLALAGSADLPAQPFQEYYIGSGAPRVLREYLLRARELVAPECGMEIGALPDDGLRFSFDWMDAAPFERQTGFSPRLAFDDAVLRTLEWVKEGL